MLNIASFLSLSLARLSRVLVRLGVPFLEDTMDAHMRLEAGQRDLFLSTVSGPNMVT